MWKVIKAWMNPVFRVLIDLFIEILPIIKMLASSAVRKIAKDAISEISLQNITDSEKRELAFARIKQSAMNEGIVLRDSLVNLLIELTIVLKKVGK